MCLIIDANVISKVVSQPADADFLPVANALISRKAKAVYGGKLAQEYAKISRIRRFLIELQRQGILTRVPDADVDAETRIVKKTRLCVSDDEHIIALSRVANVRLLCSRDQNLHIDFKNPALLNPHGDVYQDTSHSHLIRKHCF
jgi:hypothetical protein